MNVLHVTQGYWPAIGGTELLIQRVSEELVHRFGDRVTVYTTVCYNGEGFFDPERPRLPPGWEELNGVRIRRFPVWSDVSKLARRAQAFPWKYRLPFNQYLRALASGPVIPGLTGAIKHAAADLIAASSFPLLHMFAALSAARSTKRPCVLHGGLHPEDEWGFERPMIHRAIQRAYYVANTRFEADYVIARGAPSNRVFEIGVGVDPEEFGRMSMTEARARLGFDDGPVVGFIGQIGGHKGVDTLVRAMPRVWDANPNAWLLIAGARTGFYPHLEHVVASLPAKNRLRVKLLPDFPKDEKGRLFAALDVFAYPSGFESFGIAFLEAWAAGKPVIGCRCGAIPTVVRDGVDGLLTQYGDSQSLADAILTLIRQPDWREQLGSQGRRKVLERYTWPEIARRFRQVYELALNG